MTYLYDEVSPASSRLVPFQSVAQLESLGIRLWDAPDIELLEPEQIESQFVYRDQFRRDFGYVLASAEVMAVLADLFRVCSPVLDAGCGSGYLSKELTRLGVSSFAVDCRDFLEARATGRGYPINAVFQRDALGDAVSFVSNRFGAVLLVWPPHDHPFATRVAQAMLPDQLLVYEGEAAGGCTANDAFFECMADSSRWELLSDVSACLNGVHVTLSMLHDHWTVWRRLDSPRFELAQPSAVVHVSR